MQPKLTKTDDVNQRIEEAYLMFTFFLKGTYPQRKTVPVRFVDDLFTHIRGSHDTTADSVARSVLRGSSK